MSAECNVLYARSFCISADFKIVNNFKKHWKCVYFKCHFLLYPRFGNKFNTHHIWYVTNWKNLSWSSSIVLFMLVTVCSASALTSPRTDYVSVKNLSLRDSIISVSGSPRKVLFSSHAGRENMDNVGKNPSYNISRKSVRTKAHYAVPRKRHNDAHRHF